MCKTGAGTRTNTISIRREILVSVLCHCRSIASCFTYDKENERGGLLSCDVPCGACYIRVSNEAVDSKQC